MNAAILSYYLILTIASVETSFIKEIVFQTKEECEMAATHWIESNKRNRDNLGRPTYNAVCVPVSKPPHASLKNDL